MHRKALLMVLVASGVLANTCAFAQEMNHSAHAMHVEAKSTQTLPSQPGDAGFAAIAEIVQLLARDPETPWERVDIDALRTHLVDMNQLVLAADVADEWVPDGLRMRISRAGAGGQAATRMVPSHGPVLVAETGWSSQVEVSDDQIVWTVRGASEREALRIRALGFFGLMVTGDHHQAHHLALARGETAH